MILVLTLVTVPTVAVLAIATLAVSYLWVAKTPGVRVGCVAVL